MSRRRAGIWKPVLAMAAMLLLACGMPLAVRANGSGEGAYAVSGELKQTEANMPARREKNAGAPVVMEFQSGSLIYVTDEDEDWYEVFYQGETLFVDKRPPAEDVTDKEAIAREMERQQESDAAWVEMYAAREKARASSRRWRIVIGAVIAACLLIAVITAVVRRNMASEH